MRVLYNIYKKKASRRENKRRKVSTSPDKTAKKNVLGEENAPTIDVFFGKSNIEKKKKTMIRYIRKRRKFDSLHVYRTTRFILYI